MAEAEANQAGADDLEARVRVVERAAEMAATTLFALRTTIDAIEARRHSPGDEELQTRLENIGQQLTLLRTQADRLGAALGMRRAKAAVAEGPSTP